MPPSSRSYRDYTIGWISVVKAELVAALAMLDEDHEDMLPAVDGDNNNYSFGRIGRHNVVIASLPSGVYGTNPAATVAAQMRTTFPWMRFGLLVGIGGGVPNLTADDPADIRLGDVVVSDPTYHLSGVVQYDRGRTKEGDQWPERTGTLNKPPPSLLTAVSSLKAKHHLKENPLERHLTHMIHQHPRLAQEYTYQGQNIDILFDAGYKHEGSPNNCDGCDKSRCILRPTRQSTHPHIYYGAIASGNQVVKDSVTRDYWRDREGILCFEMEAAGLMDSYPCLVIRGICDYADSHKNMSWQPYAAATAAAYAKDLLAQIAPSAVNATDPLLGGQPELGNVHWMVPRNTNRLFTGRKDILEKLDRSLRPHCNSSQIGEQQKRFVIVGDSGIRKSEVCLKFANDTRNSFWGTFWIDASSEATARQTFIDLGKLCGADAENFEQVKTWLANTRRSWLLIIDNADDPKIDYAAYFPSGNRGSIIVTTRNPHCREHATVGSEDLDHLDLRHATSLLFMSAAIATSSPEGDQKAAEIVVRNLAFHTLAIVQAGAFIKRHRCSLEEYPFLLKKQEEHILKYCPTQDRSSYGSVFATFEVSATHLQSAQDQSAADALSLLQILGFLHSQEIPALMFSRAWEEAIDIREQIARGRPQNEIHILSELQTSRLPAFMIHANNTARHLFLWRWRETLDLLESYSLIKIAGSGESLSFSMHPLVHTWTRIRHDLAMRQEGWRAAGSIIALSMRGTRYDMFHEKLRSHVVAYLDHINQPVNQAIKLYHPGSPYLDNVTDLETVQTHHEICYLLLHLNHIFTLRSLLDMLETFEAWTGARAESGLEVQILTAYCLIQEGRAREAVELLERLLCIEHFDDSRVQGALAKAYIDCKQHKKAIGLLEQIVRIKERTEQAEDDLRLWAQQQLGNAYLGIEQFEKAATLLEQVVMIGEKTLVPAHRSRRSAEHSLGRAYIGIHQYEKAAKILQHLLEMDCKQLDVAHPYLLSTQFELARAYIGMGSGHCEKAAELLELVVEIRERTSAPDNPSLLTSQCNLAVAYNGMGSGHYEKAARLLELVVEIRERTLAPDDPYLLGSQRLLEDVHRRIEAEEEAEWTSTSEEETASEDEV